MTNLTQAHFTPKDMNFGNMDKLEIGFIVKGRTSGRRFTLTLNSKTSDQVVFNDIFKKAKKMIQKEGNIENLQAAQVFLKTLKEAEKGAKVDYESMGTGYKILTCICRFFSFGSHAHLDDIKDLKKQVQAKLDDLDFNKNMAMCQDEWTKQDQLKALATKYLTTDNLNLAEKVIGDLVHHDPLRIKLIDACIEKGYLDRALKNAEKLFDFKNNTSACEKISKIHLEKGNLDKAAQAAISIKMCCHEKNVALLSVAKAFYDKNDMNAAKDLAKKITPYDSRHEPEVKAFLSKLDL